MSLTSSITAEILQLNGLDQQEAQWLLERLATVPDSSPHETWRWLSKKLLTQKIPFAVHRLLHEAVYAKWDDPKQGPRPVWVPSEEEKSKTNISALMQHQCFA